MKRISGYVAPLLALWLALGCGPWQQAVPTAAPVTSPSVARTEQRDTPPTIVPTHQSQVPQQGCYYVWATRELPELSVQLQEDLLGAGTTADVRAYAFGEQCRMESGDSTFHAMETDFRVHVSIESIGDERALGTAIRAVFTAIEEMPPEQIVGPRPGRVEFEFSTPGHDSLRLNIDLARFRQEAGALEGAALLRHFQVPP